MPTPLVAPLIALCVGIVAASWCEFAFLETLLSLIALCLLAVAAFTLRSTRLAALALLAAFGFAGGFLALQQRKALEQPVAGHLKNLEIAPQELYEIPTRIAGRVRSPPEPLDADTASFVLDVERVFADQLAVGGVRIYLGIEEGENPPELRPGDRVELLARLKPIRGLGNEGSFDREDYWARQDVYMTGSVRAGAPVRVAPGDPGWLLGGYHAFRRAARERFDAAFGPAHDDAAVAVLRALLLGDKTALDQETIAAFRTTGTYHALVVSGLHVGMLALVAAGILGWLRMPRWLRAFAILAVVCSYAVAAGGALPVRRAAWMLGAYLGVWLLYRQRRALNVLAGTALLFLAVDPALLTDAGFQLSFLAVALIAGVAAPLLARRTQPYRGAFVDLWNVDRDLHMEQRTVELRVLLRTWIEPLAGATGLPRWVWAGAARGIAALTIGAGELVFVSAVIQAGLTLPLAYHFQQVSFSGALANVFLWPLLMLAVPAGALALATGLREVGAVAAWGAGGMLQVAEAVARWAPLEFAVPPPPGWLAVIVGLALATLIIALGARARTTAWAAGVVGSGGIAVLLVHPFPAALATGQLEVTAIDVGQGDSLFVAFPDGATMLVDGGGLPSFSDDEDPPLDIGEVVVLPYLRSRSLRRLDVVVATHPDADHEGGLAAVLEGLEVGELWLPPEESEQMFAELEAVALQRDVPIQRLTRGERRSFGDAELAVLHPQSGAAYRSTNNLSLVLGLHFAKVRILLTGDIEGRAEIGMLDVLEGWRGSLLKVAHHGSRTSSTAAWLERVQPPLAVVSAGFLNTFGHPAPDVVTRLEQSGARVLRTDIEGRITIRSDGRRWWVETRRNDVALLERRAGHASPRLDGVSSGR